MLSIENAHEALSQRIVVRHHLVGLTREELPRYALHEEAAFSPRFGRPML
jgi:hypothetical protein